MREFCQDEKSGRRMFSMRRSWFTIQQIAVDLQQDEKMTQVAEVTRKVGSNEKTFYRWS
jgi:hypothetical protein